MRDQIKNENYYKEQIQNTSNSIERYENLLNKVINAQGKDPEGAFNGYGILTMFYNQILNLSYSAGKEIAQIKMYLSDLLNIIH